MRDVREKALATLMLHCTKYNPRGPVNLYEHLKGSVSAPAAPTGRRVTMRTIGRRRRARMALLAS